MATSVESPSPTPLHKEPPALMFSPSSDKRFWSTLRSRVDSQRPPPDGETLDHARRLKEDSTLLLRGFDSVAHSLSQLSNNLETALEGARNLSKPPSLTEIVYATLEKAKNEDKSRNGESEGEQKEEEDEDMVNRGLKRKLDSSEVKRRGSNELMKIKKAKNLAIAMATRAASMAREVKSMQERCGLLEEENRKLRDGLAQEDDDLVRLQLEALLAEKSRLANENANLTRENQCLHQLVEYHQLTSQDLSASYENLLKGMCLDFADEDGCFRTPHADVLGFSKSLDECFDEEQEWA